MSHIERLFDVPLINTSIADFALSVLYLVTGFIQRTGGEHSPVTVGTTHFNFDANASSFLGLNS